MSTHSITHEKQSEFIVKFVAKFEKSTWERILKLDESDDSQEIQRIDKSREKFVQLKLVKMNGPK